MTKDMALPAGRAVVNGAASVSAVPASVPSAWLPFNINTPVRIKITEHGLEHLRRAHEEFGRIFPNGNPLGDWKPPKTDTEGWTEMQLWCVMRDFGGAIVMGRPVPFETEIELSTQGMQFPTPTEPTPQPSA